MGHLLFIRRAPHRLPPRTMLRVTPGTDDDSGPGPGRFAVAAAHRWALRVIHAKYLNEEVEPPQLYSTIKGPSDLSAGRIKKGDE
jgi:hypothetical protein